MQLLRSMALIRKKVKVTIRNSSDSFFQMRSPCSQFRTAKAVPISLHFFIWGWKQAVLICFLLRLLTALLLVWQITLAHWEKGCGAHSDPSPDTDAIVVLFLRAFRVLLRCNGFLSLDVSSTHSWILFLVFILLPIQYRLCMLVLI